jgi:hypothetical protein
VYLAVNAAKCLSIRPHPRCTRKTIRYIALMKSARYTDYNLGDKK